jgi:hypothetical protein
MSVHTCTIDRNGTCTDQTRDYCRRCDRCTVWAGEFCTACGCEWGVTL